jgi:diguanylate cyclase (GGDEF)-like protein
MSDADDQDVCGLPRDLRILSLAALARAVGRRVPLTELLEAATESALIAADLASVSLSRLELGTGCVRTLLNAGRLGPDEDRWPAEETYEIADFPQLRQVVQDRRPWVTSLEDPDSDQMEVALLRQLGKGSAVAAPIIVDGVMWGELYATRDLGARPLGPADVELLDAITTILALAILRTEQEEVLTRLAYHDSLTGLPNRWALDERAARAFLVPPGVLRPITVVVADINGLKAVNDTGGHAVGDELIRAVADALQQGFAALSGSLVTRVGGDEFAVLCVGHTPEDVYQVADGLCAATWDFGPGAGISCGAASANVTSESEHTQKALFVAADRAQYVAKRRGLRRTHLARDM